MASALAESIELKVSEAANLYHQLVLLVGPPRSGKTTALRELASKKSWPMVNVNLALCERLLELTAKQRALRVSRLLGQIVKENAGDVLILDNIEVLFSLELQQDPLRLLQGLARNQILVAAWPGGFADDKLTYADPTHPEFKNYHDPDAVIVLALPGEGSAMHKEKKESA